MAKVESLGVHTPTALPYLIREGLLPPGPRRDAYHWNVYVHHDNGVDVEEELLSTPTCVAWSQGSYVRGLYRFEDGEDIQHALLTNFPATQSRGERSQSTPFNNPDTIQDIQRGESAARRPSDFHHGGQRRSASSRALVVLLKTKAHIYFLQGSHHILDLPFEILRALPAPTGCILQRKTSPPPPLPPTPQVPSAPPNSFLASQTRLSASWLQSPTLTRSLGGSQPVKASPSSQGLRLDSLYDSTLSPADPLDADVPSLYALTDPLAELGMVAYPIQQPKARLSARAQTAIPMDFEGLDPAEELLYVSPRSELSSDAESPNDGLILLVTANHITRSVTVWHAWRAQENSLKDLFKRRAAEKAKKSKRRSSGLMTSLATGAATPGMRTRESLAAGASMRLPSDNHAAASSSKRTGQDDEEVMASQMDPDYQPSGPSQQPTRESRRISSLNTDIRTSHNIGGASFDRRHTSFDERRSIGHRKSRGSTPGSIFSRSYGGDEDAMDLDSNADWDSSESVEAILRHMRASSEAAAASSLFGDLSEGYKKDILVRRMHSFDIHATHPGVSASGSLKVAVLRSSRPSLNSTDSSLTLYLHDPITKDVSYIGLRIVQRHMRQELRDPDMINIPVVSSEGSLGKADDMLKVSHLDCYAVLLLNRGIVLASSPTRICPLPARPLYRVYNPFTIHSDSTDKEIGRNRTMQSPRGQVLLAHAGLQGIFHEVDGEGTHHRLQVQLMPEQPLVFRLIIACEYVLPTEQSTVVRMIWCMAATRLNSQSKLLADTACDTDWVALIAAIFFFALPLLDAKAHATLQLSRVAAGKHKASAGTGLLLTRTCRERPVVESQAWSWFEGERANALPRNVLDQPAPPKDKLLITATALALDIAESEALSHSSHSAVVALECTVKLMLGLHIMREEQKLKTTMISSRCAENLSPVIAQLGYWLKAGPWTSSTGTYYSVEGASEARWAYVNNALSSSTTVPLMDEPVGVYHWFERALEQNSCQPYPTLAVIAGLATSHVLESEFVSACCALTPRLCTLSAILARTNSLTAKAEAVVEALAADHSGPHMLETLPEAIAAPFREAITRCGRAPPANWPDTLLELVGRDELSKCYNYYKPAVSPVLDGHAKSQTHNIESVCWALEHSPHGTRTKEFSRYSVSQLIFKQDRRMAEVVNITHFHNTQVAECPKQPDWSDAHHFEQQRRLIEHVTMRMWALPAGEGMIHYDSITPLLTEKYLPYGFGSKCIMHPMGITLNIDRSTMSEEKVGWAYFHAGVSSGLRISKKVKGIDTSWIAFNKPSELTNRHAGLLLALGLAGHLKSLAKWLSFKYLTPKHTMTSVGLLLGLSASHLGTMDALITRMLSVHITRMLPLGAAELNVSPVTQTAGLMGIGLLYHNTQHRRMSEILLSEIENMEVQDPDSGPDPLRIESYRLAAGFALGLINLGRGRSLRGLHGLRLPERLLAMAVGPRPVSAVHVFDRATAGAIMALTCIYMKTGDKTVARKINIPDSEAQFDHVRPDMLMLRVIAHHLILWDNIVTGPQSSHSRAPEEGGWIADHIPSCYKGKLTSIRIAGRGKTPYRTADVPFYNIVTGLALALSLRYAGSGDEAARDEIIYVLQLMYYVDAADVFYYDASLARSTVRRCIDVLAVAAAVVMAGTGDIKTFRYLRRLHGRTNADTSYGSHMAAHMGIGILFLGGGTYTFGTSNLAVAMLLCAFYPLWPADVHDNRVHLQALRHFWVFAAESRCLITEDIDTGRLINMRLRIQPKGNSATFVTAPCLLPRLETLEYVETLDPGYWPVKLDFANNPEHVAAFRESQVIHMRRCPAQEAYNSVFKASFSALSDQAPVSYRAAGNELWHAVLNGVAALKEMDRADLEFVLPSDVHSSVHLDGRTTKVDDQLVLYGAAMSTNRDRLWNLKVLFAWAGKVSRNVKADERMRWIGQMAVERLRAEIEERRRRLGDE